MSVETERLQAGQLRNALHTALLIGGMLAILAGLKWLFFGGTSLILLLVLTAIVLLLSPRISPRLILRLYKARPVSYRQAPQIAQILVELTRRAGLPEPPRLYYIPSRLINALALGTPRSSAVAVTDGLLRGMNLRELVAVLAHEVSHLRNRDTWVMGVADTICRLTSILSLGGQIMLLFYIVLLPFRDVGRIPWLGILLLILAPTLSSLLQLALSRTREFEADLGAAELTGDPRGLASALAKMERLEASLFERIFLPGRRIPEPSLLRTHPSMEERIRRLLELEPQALPQPFFPADQPSPPFWTEMGLGPRKVPRWHVHGLWY